MRLKRATTPTNGVNGDARERVTKRGTEADPIIRHIAEWMAQEHPQWGIDALLTRPMEALRLGLAVAVKTGRIGRIAAAACTQDLARLQADNEAALAAAAAVCGAAMSARKRGELKHTKPTKGAQQG